MLSLQQDIPYTLLQCLSLPQDGMGGRDLCPSPELFPDSRWRQPPVSPVRLDQS